MTEGLRKLGLSLATVAAVAGPGKLLAQTGDSVDAAFNNAATVCSNDKFSAQCGAARVDAHNQAMNALAALGGEGENMSMDKMTFGEDDGNIFADTSDGGVSEAKEATVAARQKTALEQAKTASEQAKTASEQAKTVDLQEAADLAKSINSKS